MSRQMAGDRGGDRVVVDDERQRVVDLVGDAGGELAEARELLVLQHRDVGGGEQLRLGLQQHAHVEQSNASVLPFDEQWLIRGGMWTLQCGAGGVVDGAGSGQLQRIGAADRTKMEIGATEIDLAAVLDAQFLEEDLPGDDGGSPADSSNDDAGQIGILLEGGRQPGVRVRVSSNCSAYVGRSASVAPGLICDW